MGTRSTLLLESLQHKPEQKAISLSCDSHFHVFGPAEQYPYGSNLRYKPPIASLEDYLALADHLGIERMVFVQPSAYGRDNACMLDAMEQIGARCRGIVDVDENVSDAEMARLIDGGVRGVRINVSPVRAQDAGLAEKLLPRIKTWPHAARKLDGTWISCSPGG